MNDFYQSKEWAALKKKVYARYGRVCMATGLKESDGVTLSIDHIVPRSKAPKLALKLSNMQVLELGLNKTKGARIVKDWRPRRWRFYYFVIRVIKLCFFCAVINQVAYLGFGEGFDVIHFVLLAFNVLFELVNIVFNFLGMQGIIRAP